MDRRTALRKLAAGGAVAVGGSMVLSSNAIAATNSACQKPPDVPENPFLLELRDDGLYVTPNREGAPPDARSTSYSWRINRYENLGDSRALQIRTRDRGEPIVTGPTSDNCSEENGSGCPTRFFSGPDSVIVSPANWRSPEMPETFEERNTYSIQVWIQWQLSDCTLHAYYDISGEWRNDPTVTRVV